MDMGLDSLAAVEFRNRAQAAFAGIRLAPTLMFDYPTIADLTDFIIGEMGGDEEAVAEAGAGAGGGLHEPIAIVGMAGRFPGSKTNDVGEWFDFLCTGRDPVTELPLERWDIDQYYDPDRSAIGKIYVRNGAFIPGVNDFDAGMFGIQDVEARAMDPHQRLLLEVCYESLWNAG